MSAWKLMLIRSSSREEFRRIRRLRPARGTNRRWTSEAFSGLETGARREAWRLGWSASAAQLVVGGFRSASSSEWFERRIWKYLLSGDFIERMPCSA